MTADELAELGQLYRAVTVAIGHLGTAAAAYDDLAAGPLAEMAVAHDIGREHLMAAWDALAWVRERVEGCA